MMKTSAPVALVISLFAATGAGAQTSVGAFTTLNGLAASHLSAREGEVDLSFLGPPSGFQVTGDGTRHISIRLTGAHKSDALLKPDYFVGLISDVVLENDNSDVVVHLLTKTAAQAQVNTTPDGRGVRIRLKEVELAATKPADLGPRPPSLNSSPGDEAFEVVQLNYADVSEVVGLLTEAAPVKSNDLFTPKEPAFGSQGFGQQSGSPPINSLQNGQDPASDALGQSVTPQISIDRRLNAIILKGPRDVVAELKKRVQAVDLPVDSVLLETVFVELDESGAKNVGIDLSNSNSQIAVGSISQGVNAPANSPLKSAVTSFSVQAAIADQIVKGHGRIVSKPRISAASGSSAKIITGDALPILTNITVSGVNAVQQQVQYVNVGVTLQIAPRVAADGYVSSHIFCVVSNVTGTSQGIPTISQREAQTSATVHDGEAFVIGGLSQETDLSSRQKMPGLSDAPLIGGAFGAKQSTHSKMDLYIVVTPHIIRRKAFAETSASPSAPGADEARSGSALHDGAF